MKKLFNIILLSALILPSCEKQDIYPGDSLEIYLLKDYKTVQGSAEIIKSSITLENYPLVGYKDILGYDSANYEFKISDTVAREIRNMTMPLAGTAFAVAIDKEVIYSGYFWTVLSSISCDWMVILTSNISYLDPGLKIDLGYPGEINDLNLRDPRNDYRIIRLLRDDNKLIM